MDANVLQRDDDQNVRQRLGVTRDGDNFFVRHHLCVIAEQFPTACDRDRFRLLVRMIESIHCAPQTRVATIRVEWVARSGASICDRRADVRVSADAGLEPASSRRSYAPGGDDREWFDRPLRSVDQAMQCRW
jgi:hypothetical protein